jgi:hypothetical protein
MINPSEIAINLVDLLRSIPELVAEMGDAERIFAYHDRYPQNISLSLAIYRMPAPSIMVAWQGSGIGSFGIAGAWKHRFSIYVRAGENLEDDPPTGYYRLARLILKGVPTGSPQPLLYTMVHPSCHAMEPGDFARQTDAEGVDYFELPVTFTEMGDE